MKNGCDTRHHRSINADIQICICNRVDEFFFRVPGGYSIVVIILSSGLMNCAHSIRAYSLSIVVQLMLYYKIYRNQTNVFAASKWLNTERVFNCKLYQSMLFIICKKISTIFCSSFFSHIVLFAYEANACESIIIINQMIDEHQTIE